MRMTFQILLNLLLASVWMMLHDRWDINSFSIGYLVGLAIIWLLRRFFPDPFYGKRLWAILKLLYLFTKELIISTSVVIRQVTRPRLTIRPGVFKFHTDLQSDWEIALLSMLITLTPGSVVMEIAPREGIVYIHAIDADEFERGVMASKRLFENAIREVTGK
jgi:multicomponent Na+:H+ antiporter subunit E